MKTITTLAQERLSRLTATLTNLHQRVREAVASEMGLVVGEAVRDILTAALHRPSLAQEPITKPKPTPSRPSHYVPDDPWNDDENWHDPHPGYQEIDEPEPVIPEPLPSPSLKHRVTTISLGVALAHWFLTHRLPTTLVLGILSTAIVLAGGPLVKTR